MPLFDGAVSEENQSRQGSGFTETSPITGLDPKDPLGLFPKEGFTNPSFLDPTQAGNQNQLINAFMQLIQGSQGGFNQLPGTGQNLAQQGQGFVNQFGQAGQGLQQFTEQSPFLGQQIAGAGNAIDFFLNKQLTGGGGLAGQANQVGQFGGGRHAVESGAAKGTAGALFGQQVGDILGSDIQRRQQAAGQQGFLQNQGAAGGLAGLTDMFNLFQGGLLGQFGGLNQLQGLLGPPSVVGGGGTGGGAGGGGLVGGVIGAFSDERLKENIVPLGTLASGQPFYRFNYIGYPDRQFIGVMAQESPSEAVSVHESGYLMVNYGMIH